MSDTYRADLSAQAPRSLLTAFIALEITGSHVIVPIVIATLAFCKLDRCKYLINLCITGTFSGIVYSLLYYAGQTHSDGITPLCVAQAGLVFSMPPMVSAALLVVTFNLSSDLQNITNPKSSSPQSLTRTTLFILFPYFVFFVFMVPGAIVAMADESQSGISHRHYFYCSVTHGQYSVAAALGAASIMAVVIYLAVKILVITVKHCVVLQNRRVGYSNKLSYVVRVLIFTILVVVAYSLAIMELLTGSTVVPDMFIAALSVALGLLFASSRDVWMTWIKLRAAPDDSSPLASSPGHDESKESEVP